MMRYKKLFTVLIILFYTLRPAEALRCDKTPKDYSSGKRLHPEDRFSIEVSGDPEFYVPYECYIVSLETSGEASFTSFTIVAEGESRTTDVGELIPMEGTIHSHRCKHAVQQQTLASKTRAEVKWIAPPPGQKCVEFRAMVVENRDVWYMDDGRLTKRLCEQELPSEEPGSCCPCNEAKYEMAFEGLWSRLTHPKNFPTKPLSAYFGVTIGASHNADYMFWKEGETASAGVKELAEKGWTHELESELKSNSANIRTIIKAPGLQNSGFKDRTYSVFRVDPEKHMVSLVSKIHPSPDWIVGVSGVDLCDCSTNDWVKNLVIELYPWDVGTDSGLSYESEDEPTLPAQPIHRIRNYFPDNITAPFYDASCKKMYPLAQLYLTKKRTYERKCEDIPVTTDRPHRPNKEICRKKADPGDCTDFEEKWFYNKRTKECETFEYGGCNGNKNRFDSKRECMQTCARRLDKTVFPEREDDDDEYRGETENEGEGEDDNENDVVNENEEDENEGENEEEDIEDNETERNEEEEEDNGGNGDDDYTSGGDDETEIDNDYGHRPFPFPSANQTKPANIITGIRGRVVDCKVTNWSPWTPCSATCGRAWRKRTRRILAHNENGGRACPKKLLMKKKCRHLGRCRERHHEDRGMYDEDYQF